MYIEETYLLGRKCEHCGKSISDQTHGSRKHCPRVKDADGRIQNCKDRRHSNRYKHSLAPFKWMAKCQKYYHHRIAGMYQKLGETVTREDINRFGINLSRPFELRIMENKHRAFYYHEFAIEELGDNKFKIIRHGIF